jgi:hypothetical protein
VNIFEYATRNKLRFASIRGLLTVEQLWELSLQSKEGFDLDSVAKTVNMELKSQAEESFVSTTPAPKKRELEIALEVVKHIIAFKLEQAEMVRLRKARTDERERLLNILASKEEQALNELTPDEIRKRLDALEA